MRTLRFVPAIHRATHAVGVYLEESSPRIAASQGEAHLLAHLFERGASSIAELHEAFAHKRSTLTSYLDRLERKALVKREVHPGDRRSFVVTLTAAGARLAARVHARLSDLEKKIEGACAAKDARAFDAVLAALLAAAQGARSGSTKRARATGARKRSGE